MSRVRTRRTSHSTIVRDGDDYVINGRKWWTSGAADPRCKICLFLGQSATPTDDKYLQHSLVLIPMDTPGVNIKRTLPVFGYDVGHGHCEIEFDDVRVPGRHLLGGRGGRIPDRPGSARARAASITACARSGWPSAPSS